MWILIAIILVSPGTSFQQPVSIVTEFHSEKACMAELTRMQSASKIRVDYISCAKK